MVDYTSGVQHLLKGEKTEGENQASVILAKITYKYYFYKELFFYPTLIPDEDAKKHLPGFCTLNKQQQGQHNCGYFAVGNTF